MSNAAIETMFSNFMRTTVGPIGTFFIFIAIVSSAMQLILKARNPKERSQIMTYLMYVGIGAAILGFALTIYGVLSGMGEQIINAGQASAGNMPQTQNNTLEDKTDWFSGIIASFIDLLNQGLRSILNWAITGDWDIQTTFDLKTVLFSPTAKDVTANSIWYLTIPFRNAELLMYSIAIVVMPIMIIAILKVSASYISTPFNPIAKKDAGEGISRWFLSFFLIILAPIFVSAMIDLNNGIIGSLGTYVNTYGTNPLTGNVTITTGVKVISSIVSLFFTLLLVKIILQLVVRKIMVLVFFVFTPIAAYMWAIKKDVAAAGIWFGEMLSNIFMQFFYCFVYTVFVMLSGSSNVNWLEALVWLTMIISLSEALRNSMQGLVQRLSGVDESAVASGFISKVTGFSGAIAAAKTTFGVGKNYTADSNKSDTGTVQNQTAETPSTATAANSNMAKQVTPIFASDGSILKNVSTARGGSATTYNSDISNPSAPIFGSDGNIINSASETGTTQNSYMSSAANVKSNAASPYRNTDSNVVRTVPGGSNSATNVPRMMNAQEKLASRVGAVNTIANTASKMVALPLMVAAAPLGADMQKLAGGVGKVIGGTVRAIGTPIAMGTTLKGNSRVLDAQGNHMRNADGKKMYHSFGDTVKNVTNSGSAVGGMLKMGSLLSANVKGDAKETEKMFETMSPSNNTHYVRWYYKPTSQDIDNFRFTDKGITASDLKKMGGQIS